MRFTAGIPAYPALFRTRNGSQTCHIGFTDGKQTDSVRTRTRNGRGKCDVRFAAREQCNKKQKYKHPAPTLSYHDPRPYLLTKPPAILLPRNGSRTSHIRFAARITADPALSWARNGRGKCDVRFATERQVHSRDQSKTRHGCPQYHIRVTTANFVSKPMHKKINRHIFLFL
mgnify:CR=1 FL=1